MSRFLRFIALAFGLAQCLFPSVSHASNSTIDSLPTEVLAAIAALNGSCSNQPFSQANIDAGAIHKVDLSGEGYPDYILNDAHFPEGDRLTCRHGGHGGKGVVILASSAEGYFAKAFDQTVWDIKLKKSSNRTTAWVTVGGNDCGQTDFTFATSILCERELVWNPKTKEFDYASLSEARFLQQ